MNYFWRVVGDVSWEFNRIFLKNKIFLTYCYYSALKKKNFFSKRRKIAKVSRQYTVQIPDEIFHSDIIILLIYQYFISCWRDEQFETSPIFIENNFQVEDNVLVGILSVEEFCWKNFFSALDLPIREIRNIQKTKLSTKTFSLYKLTQIMISMKKY